MQYRIKIIKYESGRKEYVPQVKKWWGWQSGYTNHTLEDAEKEIESHKKIIKRQQGNQIKSTTYKTI